MRAGNKYQHNSRPALRWMCFFTAARLRRYYEPLRHPSRSGPFSHELPVDPYRDHRWDFPCCNWSPMPACRRQYPGRSERTAFAHYASLAVGLPQVMDGSAPALPVSRPAQRSLALQPADSPSRLMRPSTPEAPAALLPPPPLRLLPGGAIQFPGGFISRCGPAPFTAHCNGDVTTVGWTRQPH